MLRVGVVKVLALTADCEDNSNPPVGESYQLNVPVEDADADRVAVALPQVFPFVTVIVGRFEIVAVTVALEVRQVPLSNST